MFRYCESKIENWLKSNKTALLVTGARQVGKTYSIRETLKRNKTSYFEINFYDRPDILDSLKGISDINEFIMKLQAYSPNTLIKGESVIFFDEIQTFPELMTKIKFLVDEGSFKYILSGSLLGIELNNITSFPVGYMDVLKMYPMNLFEVAIAFGVKKETISYLHECFTKRIKIDSIIHQKMLNIFYYYLIIGGMPAAVQEFLNSRNINNVSEIDKNIISQYKADFSKYEANDRKLKIIAIYDNIPSQLNKQNLRFIFTYLNKELKFDRYENSFLWLKDAGATYPCYQVDEPCSPLIMSKNKNFFKLFLNDVGLLVCNFPPFVKEKLLNLNQNQDINLGAIFENFVMQELKSNDIEPYFFKNTKVGEIDFLVESFDHLLAIEVKSGNDYKKHKALNNLINEYPKIKYESLVLSRFNLETESEVTYLPIYMTGFIGREEEPHNYDVSKFFDTIKGI